MTKYEKVTKALRGMRKWFELNLELDPDNEWYKSGKAVCTEALDLLLAQTIALRCYAPEEEE